MKYASSVTIVSDVWTHPTLTPTDRFCLTLVNVCSLCMLPASDSELLQRFSTCLSHACFGKHFLGRTSCHCRIIAEGEKCLMSAVHVGRGRGVLSDKQMKNRAFYFNVTKVRTFRVMLLPVPLCFQTMTYIWSRINLF